MPLNRRCLLASVASLALSSVDLDARAGLASEFGTQAIVDAARATVVDLAADRAFAGFRASLSSARAVLVFPHIAVAGLVLGGGNGVLMVRDDHTGAWNGPVFYTLGGIGAGIDAGDVNGSLVLVVRSQRALDSICRTSSRLGGNATLALGTKAGKADRASSADLVAYSKVKGAFAGVTVDGVVLDVRHALNEAWYGKAMSPAEIVLRPAAATPSADGLRQALHAAARRPWPGIE